MLLLVVSPEPKQPLTVSAAGGPIPIAGGVNFGLEGEIQCLDCTPFTPPLPVRLTHYDPRLGDMNCLDWSYDFNYCMSPTASLVRWEALWGFTAACPQEWPIGTWVIAPQVGAFICMDRGGMVTCDPEKGYCSVDILGPGTSWWDGAWFDDVILWVPLVPRLERGPIE